MKIKYPVDNYVVFDFETTGFIPGHNEVIQISAIKFENGNKMAFNKYVNIGTPIPSDITKLTGITDEMVKNGEKPDVAWSEFAGFIKAKPLIGHNSIAFDKMFLEYSFNQYGLALPPVQAYIDTAMIFKAIKLGEGPKWYESHFQFCNRIKEIRAKGVKYNLSLCCEELELDVSMFDAHRADADIEMTNLIYLSYINSL